MVSVDRQTIMETNRSLRNIKTELENLLERGVIDEAVFDQMHAALPDESPLSGPLRMATGSSGAASPASAAPASSPAPSAKAAAADAPPQPPTQAMQNLAVAASPSPGPPGYEETLPLGVPSRGPAKPVVAHARALYRYVASDARDMSFERDDKIAVYERLNQDWWMGQNLRTGAEGIFPRTYVLEEADYKPDTKAAPYAAPYAQPQYGYPPPQQQGPPPQQQGPPPQQQGPPPQQDPYNSSVPPMAVAEGGQPSNGAAGGGKVGEYGKKFGKKLGNAAIFGAGATIGGNIVNSIF